MLVNTICRCSCHMYIISDLIESFNYALRNWISSQGNAEIIVGSANQSSDSILALVIDLICAYVDMFELNVFK